MPNGLLLDSPGQWPKDRAYMPRYRAIRLQKSANFVEVLQLADQSHQLTSKLAADGSYEFLLDGKVVATANVPSALPLKFTATRVQPMPSRFSSERRSLEGHSL